jgi:hypothetical protein
VAYNPYGWDDPRRIDFDQRVAAQERQEALQREQERLLGQQVDLLDELAGPQREREAARNQARERELKDVMAWAPPDVQAAAQSLRTLQFDGDHAAPGRAFSLWAWGGVAVAVLVGLGVYKLAPYPSVTGALAFAGPVAFIGLGVAAAMRDKAQRVLDGKTKAFQKAGNQLYRPVADFLKAAEQRILQRPCPLCRQMLNTTARKCRFCQEPLWSIPELRECFHPWSFQDRPRP